MGHHQKEKNEDILYEDAYCKWTTTHLHIFWYFFPLGLPKVISLNDIEELATPEGLGLKPVADVKAWGMALNNIWWASDLTRYNYWKGKFNRTNIVVTVKDDTFRKGFSVERPQVLFPILKGPEFKGIKKDLLMQ